MPVQELHESEHALPAQIKKSKWALVQLIAASLMLVLWLLLLVWTSLNLHRVTGAWLLLPVIFVYALYWFLTLYFWQAALRKSCVVLTPEGCAAGSLRSNAPQLLWKDIKRIRCGIHRRYIEVDDG